MANQHIIRPETIDKLSLVIDGYTSASHSLQAQATDYPVEGGSSTYDHVINLPRELKLTGWVSIITGKNKHGGPERAWQAIIKLMTSRELVSVSTPIEIYPKMIIISARSSQNQQIGRSLQIELTLKERVDDADSTSSVGDTADRIANENRGVIRPIIIN